MWADLRLAARVLLKEKAFTIPSVVALVLGIAANTTVFTIVNGILLRPLPFHEPDRVVVAAPRDGAAAVTLLSTASRLTTQNGRQ
jgi:putative ABC transport system permease protein